MTVSAQTLAFEYTANGVTTTFPYQCRILFVEQLKVYVDGVLQVGGYSVFNVGNQAGGDVVFSVAPASGATVLIRRISDRVRTTDFEQAPYFTQEELLDLDQDYQTMLLQEAAAEADSSLRIPAEETLITLLPNADARANKAVVFDEDGNVTVSVDDYNDQAAAVAASAAAALNSANNAANSAAAAEASADRVDLGALDEAVSVSTAQAVIASAQAGVATTQAGISTTQAGLSTAARVGAELARDAALLSRGLWQTTAQGIGQGVAGVDSIVAGSGGTNGTFNLAFSGGTQVIAPKGYFVVAGGLVTQVVITYAGHYSAGTPTLSFAASSGLTGASATAVMGANTPVDAYFSVPQSGSDDMLILYRVDAGPVATEVARYPAAELVNKLNRGSKSSVILLLPLYPVPEGYTLSGSELFGLRVAYRSDAEGLLVNSFTLGENGFAISAGGLGLLNEVGGIAEVDDPVLSIPDLSPNDYTIAAPAEANAPLLKDDAGAKYLQFDGVNDRLDIPNAAVDRETFTFACSVALRDSGNFPTILGDSSSSNGVYCGFESSNRRPRLGIAGGTAGLITVTSASAIPLSTRTTIVYMYDGANLTIHVNGSLVATVAASGTAGAGVAARLCYSESLKAFINLYNCILLDRAVDATERATLEALVESDPMPTSPYDGALIDAALPRVAVTYGVLIEKTKAYAVGDSTVAAFAGGTAIITLVDSPRIDVNVAAPGHTIAQQKSAWVALDISKLLTGWVVVQIGLNDLNPAEAAAPAIARLQDLINTIRADIGEYRPLLISKMIPCRQRLIDLYGGTNGPIAQAKWEDINDAIAGIGPTPITGVDYRITAHVPLMDDGAGNLKPEFDTGDGIHPNTAGRQVNATAWVNALADLGIPL